MSSRLVASDAERAMLAILVKYPEEARSVFDELDRNLFGAAENRHIYRAITELAADGYAYDQPLVTQHLEDAGHLTEAGGRAGIASLWYHEDAVLSNAESYLRKMQEAAARRRIATTLTEIVRIAEEDDLPIPAILDRLNDGAKALINRNLGPTEYVGIDQAVVDALDLIAAAGKRGDGLLGYDTGFPTLNKTIGGWENGTFTIIQGAPGTGKTAFWLQTALAVAAQAPVAMVQLEMTAPKLALRALASDGRVNYGRLRRANLSDTDWSKISDSMSRLTARQVLIAPPSVQSITAIKHWFRRMHLEHGATSLWIDNVKIVEVDDKRMRDIDRIQSVTRQLKLLSREMDVPVIAIHHLHRLEKGERPTLHSGYGSSSIEQDVDNLFSLWLPSADDRTCIELVAHKTRDDEPDKVIALQWTGNIQRFTDQHGEQATPEPSTLFAGPN